MNYSQTLSLNNGRPVSLTRIFLLNVTRQHGTIPCRHVMMFYILSPLSWDFTMALRFIIPYMIAFVSKVALKLRRRKSHVNPKTEIAGRAPIDRE
jgi:hypothetical protein